MAPTLLVGDSIMVNKAVYLSRVPARGDIVVLAYPLDERRSFIERIVALPGEEILIRGHQVYVNGEVLHEPLLGRVPLARRRRAPVAMRSAAWPRRYRRIPTSSRGSLQSYRAIPMKQAPDQGGVASFSQF
jgi:signal peptidase I